MRTSRLVMVLLALAIAVPACADAAERNEAASQTQPQEGSADGVAGPPVDWERPFGETGPTFPTPADANAVLPFSVVIPDLPRPDLIQTLPPTAVARKEQVVALVYHLPEAGIVVVEESLPGDRSLGWMRETVAGHANDPVDDPTAPPAFQMVEIRDTEGMLVQGNGVGRIIWIEDGVLFDISGPTVTPEQVLAIAQKV